MKNELPTSHESQEPSQSETEWSSLSEVEFRSEAAANESVEHDDEGSEEKSTISEEYWQRLQDYLHGDGEISADDRRKLCEFYIAFYEGPNNTREERDKLPTHVARILLSMDLLAGSWEELSEYWHDKNPFETDRHEYEKYPFSDHHWDLVARFQDDPTEGIVPGDDEPSAEFIEDPGRKCKEWFDGTSSITNAEMHFLFGRYFDYLDGGEKLSPIEREFLYEKADSLKTSKEYEDYIKKHKESEDDYVLPFFASSDERTKHEKARVFRQHKEVYSPDPDKVQETIAPFVDKIRAKAAEMPGFLGVELETSDHKELCRALMGQFSELFGVSHRNISLIFDNGSESSEDGKQKGSDGGGQVRAAAFYLESDRAVHFLLNPDEVEAPELASMIAHELWHARQYAVTDENPDDPNYDAYTINRANYCRSSDDYEMYRTQLFEAEAYAIDDHVEEMCRREMMKSNNVFTRSARILRRRFKNAVRTIGRAIGGEK